MCDHKRKRIDITNKDYDSDENKRINAIELTEHNTDLIFSTLGSALAGAEHSLFLHVFDNISTTNRLDLLTQLTRWIVHDADSSHDNPNRRMYSFEKLKILRTLQVKWATDADVVDKLDSDLCWHLIQSHCLSETFGLFFAPDMTMCNIMKRHAPPIKHVIPFIETLQDMHVDRNPTLPTVAFHFNAVASQQMHDWLMLGAIMWERYYTRSLRFDVCIVNRLLVHFQPSSYDRLLKLMATIIDLDEIDVRELCQPYVLDECGFVYPLLLAIFTPNLSAWGDKPSLKTCAVAELLLTAQYRGGTCNIAARKDCLFQLVGAAQTPTLHKLFREHIEVAMFASLTTRDHPITETIRLLLIAAPAGSQLSSDVIESILCFVLPVTPNLHDTILKTVRSLRGSSILTTSSSKVLHGEF